MPVLTLGYRHCDRKRPSYIRNSEIEGGIIDEKFGGKVVRTIDDDVVVGKYFQHILNPQSIPHGMNLCT